jgi:hypothetical protein
MTLWSAGIAWRRFLQGLLVRHGQTKKVAVGTFLRLTLIGATLVVLSAWTEWPSTIIAPTALMVGVISEAVYTTVVVQPLLRNELVPQRNHPGKSQLTNGELLRFHLPLGGTGILALLLQPVMTFFLTRLEMPTLSLAAWPVFHHITLIAITPALVMPEAVISLLKNPGNVRDVRRFAVMLIAMIIFLTALFIFTSLSSAYIYTVQDMKEDVGRLVQSSIVFMLFYPGLAMAISFMRGLLASARCTKYINLGMAANLSIMIVILMVGGASDLPGLTLAAIAMNGALVGEMLLLGFITARALPISLRPLQFVGGRSGA